MSRFFVRALLAAVLCAPFAAAPAFAEHDDDDEEHDGAQYGQDYDRGDQYRGGYDHRFHGRQGRYGDRDERGGPGYVVGGYGLPYYAPYPYGYAYAPPPPPVAPPTYYYAPY